MAYDDALENPNLISKFVDMYGVVGLDKAAKVIKGENAILKETIKQLRCNFWGMLNPNPKNTPAISGSFFQEEPYKVMLQHSSPTTMLRERIVEWYI